MQARNTKIEILKVNNYIRTNMSEILSIMVSENKKADMYGQDIEQYIYNLGGEAYLLISYFILKYNNI